MLLFHPEILTVSILDLVKHVLNSKHEGNATEFSDSWLTPLQSTFTLLYNSLWAANARYCNVQYNSQSTTSEHQILLVLYLLGSSVTMSEKMLKWDTWIALSQLIFPD